MLSGKTLSIFLSFFSVPSLMAETATTIQIRVNSNLGPCQDAAKACGKLYGEVFTATLKPIQDSCSEVSAECGAGLCRHKVDMKMVQEIKASLNPVLDYVNGEVTARITGSFTFVHSKDAQISCEWPGSYEDVRFVAREAWLASQCTAQVTEICRL